jgi:hypothetical protein
MSENKNTMALNFFIDSNLSPEYVSIIGDINTYQNLLTTFTVSINSSTSAISGVPYDWFKVTIDNTLADISVFDSGEGTYNISFLAPMQAGTYIFNFNINNSFEQIFNLYNNEISISAIYNEITSQTPTNSQRITYIASSDSLRGIAADCDIDLRNNQPIVGVLNLSNCEAKGNIFIFNTRPGQSLSNKNNFLVNGNFLSKSNPSFGYKIEDKYLVTFILFPRDYWINPEDNQSRAMNRGKYKYWLQNSISSEGKREVLFLK